MVYRGSIARRLIWLSTLRRGSYPPATQDSLPAAGPALPDGIGYPQGSLRKVSSVKLSSFPGLTWRKVGIVPAVLMDNDGGPACDHALGRNSEFSFRTFEER